MHFQSLPRALHAPTHLILLVLVIETLFGEACMLWSSSLCSLLHSPARSSLLGPNNFNTLFANARNLHSSLSVRDQVLHSYTTTGEIIVLYISVFQVVREEAGRQGTLKRMVVSIPRI
jgi:hypothetical protein